MGKCSFEIHPYRNLWLELTEDDSVRLRLEPHMSPSKGGDFYVELRLGRNSDVKTVFGVFSLLDTVRGQPIYQLVEIRFAEPQDVSKAVPTSMDDIRRNADFFKPPAPPVSASDLNDALFRLAQRLTGKNPYPEFPVRDKGDRAPTDPSE